MELSRGICRGCWGASHALAIVVGTIIGSGIFLVPAEMMIAVGSSSLVYLAWIVGGLLSLFGAMTYAELGSMMPYAGGEYVYLRGAYGDRVGFLYMWTWFAVAKPASIASVTSGLARTLGIFAVFHWLDTQAVGGPLPVMWSQIFAIAVTWLITGLNYLGIKKAGDFQVSIYGAEGAADPGGGWVLLYLCFGRSWGNFCDFPGGHATGGFGGVHGGGDCHALGVRRMERSDNGGR